MAVKSATLFFYTDLQDKFGKFFENLKIKLECLCQNHPFLIALTGDLNVKTKIGFVMTNPVTTEMQSKM